MRDLVKLTVNLVPGAMDALDRAAHLCGDTRTDTVNRALHTYLALIEAARRVDSEHRRQLLRLRETADGPELVITVSRRRPGMGATLILAAAMLAVWTVVVLAVTR